MHDHSRDILTRDRLDPRNIELPDPEMIPILRAMTPAQKVAAVHRMYRRGKNLMRAGIVHQHPEWTPDQVDLEVRRRFDDAQRR